MATEFLVVITKFYNTSPNFNFNHVTKYLVAINPLASPN